MTAIKNLIDGNGNQYFPQTHTKAVIDDQGNSVEGVLGMQTQLINQAQMEAGVVPSDIYPTKGSTNWATSGGIWSELYNSTDVFINSSEVTWSAGNINSQGALVTTYANMYTIVDIEKGVEYRLRLNNSTSFKLNTYKYVNNKWTAISALTGLTGEVTTTFTITDSTRILFMFWDKPAAAQAQSISLCVDIVAKKYVESSAFDEAPTANSRKWVVSGGLFNVLQNTPKIEDTLTQSDLDIVDESHNIILRLSGGEIKTKNFDSRLVYTNDVFKNKTFSFIGDSITTYSGISGVSNTFYPQNDVNSVNKTWWYILLNLCNAQLCRISATGGSCITDGKGTAPSFQLRYNSLFSNGESGSSPDYIFILGGINDWNTNTPLGNFTEEYSGNELPSTFIPSYRRLLYNLQITYPNSQIISLTPIRAFYGTLTSNYPPTKNGNNLNDYANAIVECCKIHGAVCVDLYNMFNLNLQNINTYTIDKLHPKAIMMEKMAKIIYQNIINLF